MASPRFTILKNKGGDFYFTLKAGNGEIIATSQGYSSKASAKNGIESIKKNAPVADVIDESSD